MLTLLLTLTLITCLYVTLRQLQMYNYAISPAVVGPLMFTLAPTRTFATRKVAFYPRPPADNTFRNSVDG